MAGKSPFEDLKDEHVALLTEMNDIQSSVRGLMGGDAASLGGGAVLRDELEMFLRQLRFHFRREEEGLFPEAKRMISEGARGADVFGSFFAEEAEDDMSAHAALAQRANEMLNIAVQMEEAGSPDERSVQKLRAIAALTAGLLQRHAAKEDTLIFAMLEKGLKPDQVDHVSERLKEIGSNRDLSGQGSPEEGGLTQLGGGSE
ncbi:MAG: hemerythrin domain-containing protein [Armatimonadetes bacterium]|nr:hemerythrin domain-containing protein [Armatimonadota bacterium]